MKKNKKDFIMKPSFLDEENLPELSEVMETLKPKLGSYQPKGRLLIFGTGTPPKEDWFNQEKVLHNPFSYTEESNKFPKWLEEIVKDCSLAKTELTATIKEITFFDTPENEK